MTFNTMIDIMAFIIGEPQNDLESFILYLSASCLSVLIIFFVLYLFKLIADFSNIGGR